MKRGVRVVVALAFALSLFITGCDTTTSAGQNIWDFIKQTIGNFLQELFSGSINDTMLSFVVGALFLILIWALFHEIIKKFGFFGGAGKVNNAGMALTFAASTMSTLSMVLYAQSKGTSLRESVLNLVSPFGTFGALGIAFLFGIMTFYSFRDTEILEDGIGKWFIVGGSAISVGVGFFYVITGKPPVLGFWITFLALLLAFIFFLSYVLKGIGGGREPEFEDFGTGGLVPPAPAPAQPPPGQPPPVPGGPLGGGPGPQPQPPGGPTVHGLPPEVLEQIAQAMAGAQQAAQLEQLILRQRQRMAELARDLRIAQEQRRQAELQVQERITQLESRNQRLEHELETLRSAIQNESRVAQEGISVAQGVEHTADVASQAAPEVASRVTSSAENLQEGLQEVVEESTSRESRVDEAQEVLRETPQDSERIDSILTREPRPSPAWTDMPSRTSQEERREEDQRRRREYDKRNLPTGESVRGGVIDNEEAARKRRELKEEMPSFLPPGVTQEQWEEEQEASRVEQWIDSVSEPSPMPESLGGDPSLPPTDFDAPRPTATPVIIKEQPSLDRYLEEVEESLQELEIKIKKLRESKESIEREAERELKKYQENLGLTREFTRSSKTHISEARRLAQNAAKKSENTKIFDGSKINRDLKESREQLVKSGKWVKNAEHQARELGDEGLQESLRNLEGQVEALIQEVEVIAHHLRKGEVNESREKIREYKEKIETLYDSIDKLFDATKRAKKRAKEQEAQISTAVSSQVPGSAQDPEELFPGWGNLDWDSSSTPLPTSEAVAPSPPPRPLPTAEHAPETTRGYEETVDPRFEGVDTPEQAIEKNRIAIEEYDAAEQVACDINFLVPYQRAMGNITLALHEYSQKDFKVVQKHLINSRRDLVFFGKYRKNINEIVKSRLDDSKRITFYNKIQMPNGDPIREMIESLLDKGKIDPVQLSINTALLRIAQHNSSDVEKNLKFLIEWMNKAKEGYEIVSEQISKDEELPSREEVKESNKEALDRYDAVPVEEFNEASLATFKKALSVAEYVVTQLEGGDIIVGFHNLLECRETLIACASWRLDAIEKGAAIQDGGKRDEFKIEFGREGGEDLIRALIRAPYGDVTLNGILLTLVDNDLTRAHQRLEVLVTAMGKIHNGLEILHEYLFDSSSEVQRAQQMEQEYITNLNLDSKFSKGSFHNLTNLSEDLKSAHAAANEQDRARAIQHLHLAQKATTLCAEWMKDALKEGEIHKNAPGVHTNPVSFPKEDPLLNLLKEVNDCLTSLSSLDNYQFKGRIENLTRYVSYIENVLNDLLLAMKGKEGEEENKLALERYKAGIGKRKFTKEALGEFARAKFITSEIASSFHEGEFFEKIAEVRQCREILISCGEWIYDALQKAQDNLKGQDLHDFEVYAGNLYYDPLETLIDARYVGSINSIISDLMSENFFHLQTNITQLSKNMGNIYKVLQTLAVSLPYTPQVDTKEFMNQLEASLSNKEGDFSGDIAQYWIKEIRSRVVGILKNEENYEYAEPFVIDLWNVLLGIASATDSMGEAVYSHLSSIGATSNEDIALMEKVDETADKLRRVTSLFIQVIDNMQSQNIDKNTRVSFTNEIGFVRKGDSLVSLIEIAISCINR